jgi:hypothetical protein
LYSSKNGSPNGSCPRSGIDPRRIVKSYGASAPARRQPVLRAGQLLVLVGHELIGTHRGVALIRLLAVDDPALQRLQVRPGRLAVKVDELVVTELSSSAV